MFFLIFRIHFPDPHSRYRSSQISIIGGLENVFDARQRIMVERERGRDELRERRLCTCTLYVHTPGHESIFLGLFASCYFI